jgi:hypothetical protein
MRRSFGAVALAAGFLSMVSASRADVSAEAKQLLDSIRFDTVEVTPDKRNAKSATIKAAEGGTITAKGRDGTVYTFTVPKDALLRDAEITIAPVRRFKGPAGEAPFLGVVFEPAGLVFTRPATLQIEAKTEIKAPMPVEIGRGESQNEAITGFPLASIDEIAIFHFSAGGVAGSTSLPAASAAAPAGAFETITSNAPKMNFVEAVKAQRYIENQLRQTLSAERRSQLTSESSGLSPEARTQISQMADALEALAMRTADLQLEGLATGDIGHLDLVMNTVGELMNVARQLELLGALEASQRLWQEILALLDAYYDDIANNCAKFATDLQTILGIIQNASIFGMHEKVESLLRVCVLKRRVAKIQAGGMQYVFDNCSTDGAGSWSVAVSGGPLNGKGSGTMGRNPYLGEWAAVLNMPGLHIRMAGRIKVRHGAAAPGKYDPINMAATVDMATGCGSGGCAAGATGQWSNEAVAKVVEEHCDPGTMAGQP